ncbi:hypothetical protein [Endozoicomonas lisbonensis]|uniref:DNA repair exonuclease SbcCD ATPase subunit n=1 Tax=Endozoicomonas lisbonensis TaxID=3120522 RepID=A0ABV2SC39_9GAMM
MDITACTRTASLPESWQPLNVAAKRSFVGHAVDIITGGFSSLLQQLNHYLPANKAIETAFSITPVIGPVSRMILQENRLAREVTDLQQANHKVLTEAGSLINTMEPDQAINRVRDQARKVDSMADSHELNARSGSSVTASAAAAGLPLLGTFIIGAPLSLLSSAINYALHSLACDQVNASEARLASEEKQISQRLSEQADRWQQDKDRRDKQKASNLRVFAGRKKAEEKLKASQHDLKIDQLNQTTLNQLYAELEQSHSETLHQLEQKAAELAQAEKKLLHLQRKLNRATVSTQHLQAKAFEAEEALNCALTTSQARQESLERSLSTLRKKRWQLAAELALSKNQCSELSTQLDTAQQLCQRKSTGLKLARKKTTQLETELNEASERLSQKTADSEKMLEEMKKLEALQAQTARERDLEAELTNNALSDNRQMAKAIEDYSRQHDADVEEIETFSRLLYEADTQKSDLRQKVAELEQQLKEADELLFELNPT